MYEGRIILLKHLTRSWGVLSVCSYTVLFRASDEGPACRAESQQAFVDSSAVCIQYSSRAITHDSRSVLYNTDSCWTDARCRATSSMLC